VPFSVEIVRPSKSLEEWGDFPFEYEDVRFCDQNGVFLFERRVIDWGRSVHAVREEAIRRGRDQWTAGGDPTSMETIPSDAVLASTSSLSEEWGKMRGHLGHYDGVGFANAIKGVESLFDGTGGSCIRTIRQHYDIGQMKLYGLTGEEVRKAKRSVWIAAVYGLDAAIVYLDQGPELGCAQEWYRARLIEIFRRAKAEGRGITLFSDELCREQDERMLKDIMRRKIAPIESLFADPPPAEPPTWE